MSPWYCSFSAMSTWSWSCLLPLYHGRATRNDSWKDYAPSLSYYPYPQSTCNGSLGACLLQHLLSILSVLAHVGLYSHWSSFRRCQPYFQYPSHSPLWGPSICRRSTSPSLHLNSLWHAKLLARADFLRVGHPISSQVWLHMGCFRELFALCILYGIQSCRIHCNQLACDWLDESSASKSESHLERFWSLLLDTCQQIGS